MHFYFRSEQINYSSALRKGCRIFSVAAKFWGPVSEDCDAVGCVYDCVICRGGPIPLEASDDCVRENSPGLACLLRCGGCRELVGCLVEAVTRVTFYPDVFYVASSVDQLNERLP